MKTTNKQYAKALYEVTKNLDGADLSVAIENFVKLLSNAHKLRQASAIINEFENYAKKEEGIVSIEITSASKLDFSVVNNIKKVFGDKVESVESIDKSLMGGVSVRTEDKILDGSIKTQLQNLKQQLI
ncbi:ATP synthase F1 subunit delta [Patescibacteria group bacterium]|nr:ATP synthase F1 subunit delta [Patescibacteria group bacterium]MBU1896000.1 ATP synthase F1 subunit delta [Patescibacteria group bacterium]